MEELESLLLDWESGTLGDRGIDRVREILRESQEAREFYAQYQILNAAMRLECESGLPPVSVGKPAKQSTLQSKSRSSSAHRSFRRSFFSIGFWAVTAATLLVVVLTGRLLQLELSRPQPDQFAAKVSPEVRDENDEPTSEGIALVTRLMDVDWSEGQAPVEEGDALSPGRFAIDSGVVQIEFFSGATVIVEGPADLDLHSPLLAHVRGGRMRAQVPPAARGFSLEVDDMTVVDLGTEFGLSVTPSGANVQVFDGEVELLQPASRKRILTAGKALIRNADGDYVDTEISPDRFLDIATLASRESNQRSETYLKWQNWSDAIRRDERLIAYYTFENEFLRQRRLKCSLPDHEDLDGAIVGADEVAGRWDQKRALEFKRPGDRVRVDIPGEFQSLTFACWVKIDSLDRWYNSLFLTDHYDQGEPHWQILDTGQLFFSVRHKANDAEGAAARKETHKPILSPSFWKPALSGRWLHLATTYNADTGLVTHFLNGKTLHQEQLPENLVVPTTRIGAGSIGNWSIPTRSDSEFAIRNLNGSIDEFAIFATALSADDIKEIYEYGKP